jgi:hypothetical protein
MTRTNSWRLHAGVLLAYAAVAIAFTWPLALHLDTHVTGGGDTGVYIWNHWVFLHEMKNTWNFPYFTDVLFGGERAANLSLHNYTRFQNLLAVPLMRVVSTVTAFNLVFLLMTVLTGYSTFLLVRQVTGRVAESWLAGLLFAWSPFLATRGMGAFSLVAAAPLAVFLLILIRADGHERLRDAVALGVTMGWAASTDVYYGIYCLLLGAVFVVARVVVIQPSRLAGHARAARWGMDVLLLCAGALVLTMALSGGWEVNVFGRPVRMRSLYTPVLILTVLAAVRLLWAFRPSFAPLTRTDVWRFARLVAAAGLVGAAVMSPVLYAAAVRLTGGDFPTPQIFWRSSPPGIDALALLLPNPNHPLRISGVVEWLASRPNGYEENVASLSFVALAILLVAFWKGWRPSRWWAGVTALFALLAMGPFIHIAAINTYIPGPWAFLRYLPIVGLARSPTRFTVVMMLGFAVLVGAALAWLGRRYPERRRDMVLVTGALLAFELLPAPRVLQSAEVPRIYRHVAAAPEGVKLLELPFGIRDGTSSVGNFSTRTQYYQTAHGKTIMGGYLSRLSPRRVAELRADPVLNALAVLSENRRLTPAEETAFLAAAPTFIGRWNIGFVVIDRAAVSETLRGMAIKAFRLTYVESTGALDLYAAGRPIVR